MTASDREAADGAAVLVVTSSILWPAIATWASVSGTREAVAVPAEVSAVVRSALGGTTVRAEAARMFERVDRLVPPADRYDAESRRWELLANAGLGALASALAVLARASVESVPPVMEDVFGAIATEKRWAEEQLARTGRSRRLDWVDREKRAVERAMRRIRAEPLGQLCSELQADGPAWWLELEQIERDSPALLMPR